MRRAVLTLALLLSPSLAIAGDAEAENLYKEAYRHWNDPEPAEALRLAEQALAQAESQRMKVNVQLFIGALHQAKTGDLDAALGIYDRIIRDLVGVEDATLRRLKADAMVRKGNILYAERDDPEGALRLYMSAHEIHQLSSTADAASQLCYRLARQKEDPSHVRRFMDLALRLSREAVDLAPRMRMRDEKRQAAFEAKTKLQLVLCLMADDKRAEADRLYAEIDRAKLDDASLYQQALRHALLGEGDQATAALKRFMEETRPTAKTRNQLRKFIRTEPDFQQFLERPDWRPLTEDEPENS